MSEYVFVDEYKHTTKISIYLSVPILVILLITLFINLLTYGVIEDRVFRFACFFAGILVFGNIISYQYALLRYPWKIIIDDCRIKVKNKRGATIVERSICDISSVRVFPNKENTKGFVRIIINKRLKPIEIGNRLIGGGMSDLTKIERLTREIEENKMRCECKTFK